MEKGMFAIAAAFALTAAAQAPRQGQPAPLAQRPPAPQPRPVQTGPQIPTRVTARTLVGLCGQDNGACLTYVLGAADAYASALVAAGRPQVFCFPQGTTNQQIVQSSVQYLRARPQEGNLNGALALLSAFTTIYPCPR